MWHRRAFLLGRAALTGGSGLPRAEAHQNRSSHTTAAPRTVSTRKTSATGTACGCSGLLGSGIRACSGIKRFIASASSINRLWSRAAEPFPTGFREGSSRKQLTIRFLPLPLLRWSLLHEGVPTLFEARQKPAPLPRAPGNHFARIAECIRVGLPGEQFFEQATHD